MRSACCAITGYSFAWLLLVLLTALLAACSSSRVVLLDAGSAGQGLCLTTAAGELALSEVNSCAQVRSASSRPQVRQLSAVEVDTRYGALIDQAPLPPVSFLLYFTTGGTDLQPASRELLPQIEQAIVRQVPCAVNIIGHSDRTGSREYNVALSLRRAQAVQRWLESRNLDILAVSVESYGEEDPLVPTADNVAEPRNRRVELLIR